MGTRRLHSADRRRRFGRWSAGAALGALVLVAAACSSGSSSSTTTTSGNGTGSTGTTGPSATIRATSVGSLGTVLVNASGMTLYHFTHDTNGQSACMGDCTSLWPPLQVPAGSTPVAGSGLASGAFGTITRSDGTTPQVTYHGMPLYTYSGDKKPGDASGQNIAGAWFAVTTSPSGTASGGGTTTTTSGHSGGYGY